MICLMRERTPFPKGLISQLPNLRLLVTTGPRNPSIAFDRSLFTVDFHEDIATCHCHREDTRSCLNALPADLRRKHLPEPVPPEPYGFMADAIATFVQQVFDVSERSGNRT